MFHSLLYLSLYTRLLHCAFFLQRNMKAAKSMRCYMHMPWQLIPLSTKSLFAHATHLLPLTSPIPRQFLSLKKLPFFGYIGRGKTTTIQSSKSRARSVGQKANFPLLRQGWGCLHEFLTLSNITPRMCLQYLIFLGVQYLVLNNIHHNCKRTYLDLQILKALIFLYDQAVILHSSQCLSSRHAVEYQRCKNEAIDLLNSNH